MAIQPGKKVIIIAGPTAVGKTALAIDAARALHTEIISADSRQCYRELKIGVARPTEEELNQVPHYFIASHSIHDEITAVGFEEYALDKAKQLFQHHDTIVMTGGTGLYIRAFCEGMDTIPWIDPEIRQQVMRYYDTNGLTWLQEEIQKKDPAFYQTGETQNPQRLMRALEVVEATGQSILEFRKGNKKQREFEVVKIMLDLPREQLYDRINFRVDQMMEMGLMDEVASLLPYKDLNALQTVGYSELFDQLEGKSSLEQAIEKIKMHTRRYAKRQLTWFRKEPGWQWYNAGEREKVIEDLTGLKSKK